MDDACRSPRARSRRVAARSAGRSSEAGGGESEGFELAEQELIEHASHGDEHTPARIMRDAARAGDAARSAARPTRPVYGEADEEHKTD